MKEKKMEFKSLLDFINRVNPKDVNKLQLEGLTKAGVFDELEKDRNKIFNSIPKIIQKLKLSTTIRLITSRVYLITVKFLKRFDFLPSPSWSQKELLSEEFKSLVYISDHPLNEYEEVFKQLNIISYNQFYNNNDNEAKIAGTIMSIQEKKSAKGTPYGIIKFSDQKGEFELFLFENISS